MLARLQSSRTDIEQRKAKVMVEALKYSIISKISIVKFTENKSFDPFDESVKASKLKKQLNNTAAAISAASAVA